MDVKRNGIRSRLRPSTRIVRSLHARPTRTRPVAHPRRKMQLLPLEIISATFHHCHSRPQLYQHNRVPRTVNNHRSPWHLKENRKLCNNRQNKMVKSTRKRKLLNTTRQFTLAMPRGNLPLKYTRASIRHHRQPCSRLWRSNPLHAQRTSRGL